MSQEIVDVPEIAAWSHSMTSNFVKMSIVLFPRCFDRAILYTARDAKFIRTIQNNLLTYLKKRKKNKYNEKHQQHQPRRNWMQTSGFRCTFFSVVYEEKRPCYDFDRDWLILTLFESNSTILFFLSSFVFNFSTLKTTTKNAFITHIIFCLVTIICKCTFCFY